MKKSIMLGLFLIIISACATQATSTSEAPVFANGEVHHPEPKTPKLIASDLLPEYKKNLAPPPVPGSKAQAADEKELRSEQQHRTPQDCERAKMEIQVSLQTFFGAPHGPLNDRQVAALTSSFDQIRNDGDYYIQGLKKEFPRKRPFLYLSGLEPCVAKEVTGAYPSGHAALAQLYSRILSDLIPAQKKAFAARARTISQDRVMAGMHHPTDIATGRKLGDLVYQSLKSSPKYRELFSEMKKRIE